MVRIAKSLSRIRAIKKNTRGIKAHEPKLDQLLPPTSTDLAQNQPILTTLASHTSDHHLQRNILSWKGQKPKPTTT